MELYTSLTRLKMSMNNGELPPMTPLSERALRLIDPAFTIGMGALVEDSERGLRCPVRGCGEYKHHLSKHISHCHRSIGGSGAIRDALGISANVPLMSPSAREALRKLQVGRRGHLRGGSIPGRVFPPRQRLKASINSRNMLDRCEAQVLYKLVTLQARIGRSPTMDEAAAEYGKNWPHLLKTLYGSWNAAKGACGLTQIPRGGQNKQYDGDSVLESLGLWYKSHGELPEQSDAKKRERVPVLPAPASIYKAMKTPVWGIAMQRAASLLNIYGGEYGLPIENRKAS